MLTPSQVKIAQPASRPYKLYDEKGMFLLVTPSGGKLWRYKYRKPVTRSENLLGLGRYPEISLRQARDRRDEARRLLANGIDPGDERRRRREAMTFASVARQWLERWQQGKAGQTLRKTSWILSMLLPDLGPHPIERIDATLILSVLRQIELRGRHETAHRASQVIRKIFAFAVASGIVTQNPALGLGEALTPVNRTNRAALTNPAEIGRLLRAIDGYQSRSGGGVRRALLMLAFTFVRPGELRGALLDEIDLEGERAWVIPASRMKMRKAHVVPLSSAACALVTEQIRERKASDSPLLFPGSGGRKPISDNTLNAALRRMGYSQSDMTAHGFRALASTRLHEMGWAPHVIEAQLAHVQRNQVAAVYNRAAYLSERRTMMEQWAEYLDLLRHRESD